MKSGLAGVMQKIWQLTIIDGGLHSFFIEKGTEVTAGLNNYASFRIISHFCRVIKSSVVGHRTKRGVSLLTFIAYRLRSFLSFVNTKRNHIQALFKSFKRVLKPVTNILEYYIDKWQSHTECDIYVTIATSLTSVKQFTCHHFVACLKKYSCKSGYSAHLMRLYIRVCIEIPAIEINFLQELFIIRL